jgi:5-methylthioadenosine/S-adenosylhomocysteine deaminase
VPARRLAARWVVPVAAPPIECGAVLLGTDGRIEAVGPDALVPRPAGAADEVFPDAILIPGLVNAHTHLELTGFDFEGPPEPDFRSWILRVRRVKETRSPDEFAAAAQRGLRECWAGGVTTVGDTGDSGSVIRALAELGGSGVAYQEVFGPHPSQAAASLAGLQGRLEELSRWASGRVRLGVSPHAPYTVSGPLYAAVAEWAGTEKLPLAVHLAESRGETELLRHGSGPFAEAWRERGIPLPAGPACSPVEWVERHGVLGERTLCIHMVQADGADLARLSRRAAAVAHCPLSNAAHGHGTAPLDAFLAYGIHVGLGTDSVLSVGTPDLLAEARAARRLAPLDADAALGLATLGGARALRLEGEIGSLEPGKWGDCAVVLSRSPAGGPAEQVLQARREDVVATFLGGRDVYRADRVRT